MHLCVPFHLLLVYSCLCVPAFIHLFIQQLCIDWLPGETREEGTEGMVPARAVRQRRGWRGPEQLQLQGRLGESSGRTPRAAPGGVGEGPPREPYRKWESESQFLKLHLATWFLALICSRCSTRHSAGSWFSLLLGIEIQWMKSKALFIVIYRQVGGWALESAPTLPPHSCVTLKRPNLSKAKSSPR